MNDTTDRHGAFTFALGLAAGTAIGAGLMMWLAPRVAGEIRERLNASADAFGRSAAERYEQATARAGAMVDELNARGNTVRDDLADAVANGAHEVERVARNARSHRTTVTS
jgi:gas vesicle protein